MQNLDRKVEYQKSIARFIELFIWFLILALFIGSIIFYNKYSHENHSRYQIFLQDVDGIIVGSPVKMLGIPVGYVKHINFVNDTVFVDFIIDKKGVEIPNGSKITVEFSGLGGSKSLEIYPPTEKYDSDTPPLIIQQPRRLGASLSLLNSMINKIGLIIFRCNYFSQSLKFDEIKPMNNKEIQEKLIYDTKQIFRKNKNVIKQKEEQ